MYSPCLIKHGLYKTAEVSVSQKARGAKDSLWALKPSPGLSLCRVGFPKPHNQLAREQQNSSTFTCPVCQITSHSCGSRCINPSDLSSSNVLARDKQPLPWTHQLLRAAHGVHALSVSSTAHIPAWALVLQLDAVQPALHQTFEFMGD